MYEISCRILNPSGSDINLNPIYGEELKISEKRADGEMYQRRECEGKLTFVREDYDRLSQLSLDDKIRFEVIYRNEKEARDNEIIVREDFTKMDMSFDYFNDIAEMDIHSTDRYESFLQQIDVEQDLVKLAPPRTSLKLYRRAFLQLYMMGSKKITNVLGNMSYEIDATSGADEKTDSQIRGYGFSLLKKFLVLDVDISSSSATQFSYLNGKYSGVIDGVENKLVREDGEYYLARTGTFRGNVLEAFTKEGQRIIPEADGAFEFDFFTEKPYSTTNIKIEVPRGEKIIGTSGNYARNIYGRILTNYGYSDYTINSSDDLCTRNFNYKSAVNANSEAYFFDIIANGLISSLKTQDEPTEWMQNDEGKYFVAPEPEDPTDNIMAIGWDNWIPMSFWFESTLSIAEHISQYDEKWTMADAYSVEDAIVKLLEKIDPKLEFKSDFLARNLNNPILGDVLNLYITPITNVKKTYYEQAAQKGKITLKQILDMLKSCFQCYWFLEPFKATSQGRPINKWRLRIEHYKWFYNGGSYSSNSSALLVDMTKLVIAPTFERWGFDQERVSYDREKLRSRVEFGWGEKCSEAFNGYPLITDDYFAKNGGIEKVSVDNFISDLDLIISSPEKVTDDCFALIGTDENNSVYRSRIEYRPNPGSSTKYLAQNNYLSFYSLEQIFWRYNMNGFNIRIGVIDKPLTPHSVKNIRSQSARCNYELKGKILGYNKVKTYVGEGYCVGITTNLMKQYSEFELVFGIN